MARSIAVVGSVLVSILAVACASSEADEGPVAGEASAATGVAFRAVDVTVSAKKTGENYEARAYPIDDVNGDGLTEYYRAPVFYVYVDGVNAAGQRERREWKAPRYMPYNNPAGARHDNDYRTVGFVTSGLSSVPRMAVPQYKPDYEVHNTFSPFGGAIVVKGSFYIHAGPENVADSGWGSAGCVEILGNFDAFKKDILELAGSPVAAGTPAALNAAMSRLVAARKLFVTYENAARPDIHAALSRQVSGDEQNEPATSAPLKPRKLKPKPKPTAATAEPTAEPDPQPEPLPLD